MIATVLTISAAWVGALAAVASVVVSWIVFHPQKAARVALRLHRRLDRMALRRRTKENR